MKSKFFNFEIKDEEHTTNDINPNEYIYITTLSEKASQIFIASHNYLFCESFLELTEPYVIVSVLFYLTDPRVSNGFKYDDKYNTHIQNIELHILDK